LNRSRRWDRATWLLLFVACRADAPTPPEPIVPVASVVTVIAGDGQQADPEDALDEPIRFRANDKFGTPVSGVILQLTIPIGGGSVPRSEIVTDSAGFAETPWTMGPLGGVQQLQASMNDTVVATATATTCDPGECFPPSRLAGSLSDATLLSLATYESSGESVHPDVVRGHRSATGYWMAITPYPAGNSLYENPSIFRSRNTVDWSPPKGVQNPLVFPEAPAYLSDPDIVVDATNTLWMYYRAVSGSENIIKVIQSGDGVRWGAPTTVVTVPSHRLVSPAVVRGAPHALWQMWSVNAGPQGCSVPQTTIERRTSDDGVHWGTPIPVNLAQPGQSIWHIDVQWIAARHEYWALYNTYIAGTSCVTSALYLARSSDGVEWTTYPSPIARAGVVPAFQHVIYRSTFLTNPAASQVTLFMSGAVFGGSTYHWSTASVTTTTANLFAIASVPASMITAVPVPSRLPPPERDIGPDH
jgi:hypothetical protein